MTEDRRYPHHVCACDDADLSQAYNPVISRNGQWVQISCGAGHYRAIPRARWEAELQRREAAQVSCSAGADRSQP